MIRTLVAESVALMRAGLLTLLAEQPGIEVIADLDRAELIMPAALASQSDVAIIDERIEGGEFVIIRTLHTQLPVAAR